MFIQEVPTYRYNLLTHANVWSNQAALRWYGYSQKELHSFGDRLLEALVHQDDQHKAITHLEQARFLTEGQSLCYMLRIWPKEGLTPKFAQICHRCVEVGDDGLCVEIEGFLREISQSEFDIRKLLEREVPARNLVLHYQPICDLQSGAVQGYEALARLRRGTQYFPPAVFLPYLDGPLEVQWVEQQIEQICTALAQLEPPLTLSFNACQAILETPILLDAINGHFRCERVGLEVLESISLASPAILANLRALRGLGLTLKADDVGAEGYGGGLDRLLEREIFSAVKLDHNLTARLLEDSYVASLTKHLLAMCNEAGLMTIAEWVETPDQRQWLIDHGCQQGQGALFGMAAPLFD